jgi:hypothetical protein
MNYYPNNTLANYTTKLPQLFDLNGEWEVGLYEIQFPISWYNVSSEEAQLFLMALDEGVTDFIDVSPPGGHYENPETLVKQINDVLISKEKSPESRFYPGDISKQVTVSPAVMAAAAKGPTVRFLFQPISKKISVEFKPKAQAYSSMTMKMSKDLAELLGFEWRSAQTATKILNEIDKDESLDADERFMARLAARRFTENANGMVELTPGKSVYTAERVCDLQRGFYSLFIYCDLVEPIVVGDAKVPLLRTVNIAGRESLTVSRIYQNVQYVPVHKKQFDTIELDIRDDTGRKVPFERGKVIVTLHFRLRKPAYF